MEYGDFTIESVQVDLGLTIVEHRDLFADVPLAEPSDLLKAFLQRSLPHALLINTEKARSEGIIFPILGEVRAQLDDQVSVFSGTEFNVDSNRGLRGYCDFIVSRSPLQHFLTAPVVIIAESKNADLVTGFGQCIAGMLAARLYNEKHGKPISPIYGAVSTGELWKFLKLEQDVVTLDRKEYVAIELPKILAVLKVMAKG